MKITATRFWMSFLCFAMLCFSPLAATADGVVIERGIDIWHTPADASTRADFRMDPIPAGFFCRDSRPFQGSLVFQGAPVETQPADALAGADTVIHRLDDVAFDGPGARETRIQVAALSLVSMLPVETRCGQFNVRATLAGEQPVTHMQIAYDGIQGGTYAAPLDLVVRLVFTPVGDNGLEPRQLVQKIALNPAPDSRWTHASGRRGFDGHILVDTDGDHRPETLLPGPTGDFYPGDANARNSRFPGPCFGIITCHANSGHDHCVCNPY